MDSGRFNRGEKLSTLKLTVVQYGILLMMLALAAGLWRLQVLGADNYRLLAEQNRIRKEPVLAARGKLFDRDGRLLVDNYPSVSCFLVREQSRNVDADLPLIAKGLDLDLDQLRATLRHLSRRARLPAHPHQAGHHRRRAGLHRGAPQRAARAGDHRRGAPPLSARRICRPPDRLRGRGERRGSQQSALCAYEPGDVVGKAGVEETYDQLLRGQDGSRDVIVDSHGREVGYLGIQHAIPGQDLKLTIDNDLQRAAELALGDANGAIVAMDPRNGEILAMVSRPSFDPNAFAVRINRDGLEQAHHRPRPSADEQGHPGSARSRVDLQDHHVGRRPAGRRLRRTCM